MSASDLSPNYAELWSSLGSLSFVDIGDTLSQIEVGRGFLLNPLNLQQIGVVVGVTAPPDKCTVMFMERGVKLNNASYLLKPKIVPLTCNLAAYISRHRKLSTGYKLISPYALPLPFYLMNSYTVYLAISRPPKAKIPFPATSVCEWVMVNDLSFLLLRCSLRREGEMRSLCLTSACARGPKKSPFKIERTQQRGDKEKQSVHHGLTVLL